MRSIKEKKFAGIHCSVICLLPLICFGQDTSVRISAGVASEWKTQIVSEAIELDHLLGVPQDLTRIRNIRLWQSSKETPNKGIDGKNLFRIPSPLDTQSAVASGPRSAISALAPNLQIDGFAALSDDNTTSPPDAAGAISPDHVLTALNSEFRIQDRKGKTLSTLSMARFWAPLGPFKSFLTDPRVAWDPNVKRFVMIMLADLGESTSAMMIARSKTSDPFGEWRMTRITPGTTGRDFDYPIMAIAGKALAISVDVFSGASYEKTLNLVILLSNLYSATEPLNFRSFDDFLGSSAPAADSDQNRSRVLFVNNSYFLSNGAYAMVFKPVTVSPGGEISVSPLVAAVAGDIAAFSGGEILPQLGSDRKIDSGNGAIQNCVARGTSVWCVNTMVVRFNQEFRTVVQYYRINWPESGDPTLTERVRVDDSSGANFYAFPSIAVNKNLELLIGYNRFNKTEFVGGSYAFRRPSDQPGALFVDGPLKVGEDSYVKGNFSNRWGDYSTTVVDPADDTSFWTLQEYAASRTESGTSLWGTYWAKLALRNGPCTMKLDRSSIDLPTAGATFRVAVTPSFPDCIYLAAPNAAWIQSVSSSRLAAITTYEYQVGLNRRPFTRSATITFGNELFTVRQAANPSPPAPEPILTVVKFDAPTTARVGDSISLNATVRNSGTKGAGKFRIGFYLSTGTPVTNRDIFTAVGCPQNQGLLTDELASCSGTYQLEAGLSPGTYYLAAIADDRDEILTTDRSASTRLSDSGTLTVQAAAVAPALSSAGVVSGATALAGPVSPGGIVVIYGARLGPAALTTLTLDAQGKVSNTLAGTRILFDTVPSPLIYTSAGQVSAIVPYGVSGKSTTLMTAELNGLKSAAISLPVAAAIPGFFSVDFSGRNQIAALNEDGSVNATSNAAERGKLIVLYGTGAGTFKSSPIDGAVIGLPLPEFLAPLTLQIGGVEAQLFYAGPAPGLVSGVFQINARIPDGIDPGDRVTIRVKSGSIESPTGTTIAVK